VLLINYYFDYNLMIQVLIIVTALSAHKQIEHFLWIHVTSNHAFEINKLVKIMSESKVFLYAFSNLTYFLVVPRSMIRSFYISRHALCRL